MYLYSSFNASEVIKDTTAPMIANIIVVSMETVEGIVITLRIVPPIVPAAVELSIILVDFILIVFSPIEECLFL